MENPIYIALSRQTALQRQLDVVANNVANMNTPAFKQQRMIFQEYLSGKGEQKISMVTDLGVMRDTRDGPMSETGNKLDLAIEGDAYFTVQSPEGPRYTRAGRFRLDEQRQIVDSNGYPVLGPNGQTITLPPNTAEISINEQGTVSTETGQVGEIELVRFDNEQTMIEMGNGLYSSSAPPVPAEDVKLHQGMVEGSNVQPIVEMTNMISILREYQTNQKMLETEHDRQRDAINKLARVS